MLWQLATKLVDQYIEPKQHQQNHITLMSAKQKQAGFHKSGRPEVPALGQAARAQRRRGGEHRSPEQVVAVVRLVLRQQCGRTCRWKCQMLGHRQPGGMQSRSVARRVRGMALQQAGKLEAAVLGAVIETASRRKQRKYMSCTDAQRPAVRKQPPSGNWSPLSSAARGSWPIGGCAAAH